MTINVGNAASSLNRISIEQRVSEWKDKVKELEKHIKIARKPGEKRWKQKHSALFLKGPWQTDLLRKWNFQWEIHNGSTAAVRSLPLSTFGFIGYCVAWAILSEIYSTSKNFIPVDLQLCNVIMSIFVKDLVIYIRWMVSVMAAYKCSRFKGCFLHVYC